MQDESVPGSARASDLMGTPGEGHHRRARSLDMRHPRAKTNLVEVVRLPLVSGPLCIIAATGGVYLLVFFRGPLVVFVFSIFVMYIVRPIVLLMHTSPATVFAAFQQGRCRRLRSVRFCRCDSVETDAADDRQFRHLAQEAIDPEGLLATVQEEPSTEEAEKEEEEVEEIHTPTTPHMQTGQCRLPYWMSVVLALVIFCGILSLVVYGCVIDIAHFVSRIDVYKHELQNVIDSLKSWCGSEHIDLDSLTPKLKDLAESLGEDLLIDVLAFLAAFVVVVIFTVYLLTTNHNYPRGSVRDRVNFQIQRYIFLKAMICMLVGMLISMIFWCLNANLAFTWGVITFVCNWVPNLGSLVATIAPIPVIALDPTVTVGGSHLAAVILAVVLPTICHQTVGNYIEPKVFGSEFDLHPVIVLIALTCWTCLWGIPGAILAVPLTATIRILLVDVKHPFASIIVALLEGELGDIGDAVNQMSGGQKNIPARHRSSFFVKAWDWGKHG